MLRHVITLALAVAVSAASMKDAAAICRIVGEPDSPPPVVQPRQSVLFIKRTNVEVGCDDNTIGDTDAGLDAGDGGDAGADAGSPPIDPVECQTLPEAITMVVQPRFTVRSDGSAFALLMVTPTAAHIQLERASIFTDLAEATKPLVDVREVYVEDPRLGYQCNDPKFNNGSGCAGGFDSGGGGGGTFDPPGDPEYHDPETDTVETVGPYGVARLSATNATELADSLTALGYIFVQADIDAIAPYLDLGFQVVAVRIDVTDELVGGGLEPLSFTYPGTEMRLPLGISRQLVESQTSIALYTIAEGRYEFPGSTVSYAQYNGPGEFLTRSNLIATLDQGPEGDPIAVKIPGAPTFVDTVVVDQEIRIPSSECPGGRGGDDSITLCGCRNAPGGGSAVLFLITLGLASLVLRRRRLRAVARSSDAPRRADRLRRLGRLGRRLRR